MAYHKGFVSIVGAGPGNPELLTLKALRVIKEAHVVVYDRLISEEILATIPPGVSRIFAGKSCKNHFMTQGETNALLVSLAQTGRRVVRLKGGDPFIFGRGGEEAEYLAQHNIPFEIVPGVTSASGCSAIAGIPLTYRELASGVRYVTGHLVDTIADSRDTDLHLNWKSLADPDTTLVVYMGLAQTATIVRQLIKHGLPHTTPAAAIENATHAHQRVHLSTLSHIAADVEALKFISPTTLIIGRVVEMAKRLGLIKPAAKGEAESSGLPRSRKAALPV